MLIDLSYTNFRFSNKPNHQNRNDVLQKQESSNSQVTQTSSSSSHLSNQQMPNLSKETTLKGSLDRDSFSQHLLNSNEKVSQNNSRSDQNKTRNPFNSSKNKYQPKNKAAHKNNGRKNFSSQQNFPEQEPPHFAAHSSYIPNESKNRFV